MVNESRYKSHCYVDILTFLFTSASLKLMREALEVLESVIEVESGLFEFSLVYHPHMRLTASSHWLIVCSYALRMCARGWNTAPILRRLFSSSFDFHIPGNNSY